MRVRFAVSWSALVVLVVPAFAFAAADIWFANKGTFALATFSSTDASGCVSTAVLVEAGEQAVHGGPGRGTPSAATFVVVSQSNTCTGETRTLFGFADNVAFTADSLSTTAHLSTPIDLCADFNDPASCTANTIDMTWTSTSDAVRFNGADHLKVGTQQFLTQAVQTFRFATAVGTLGDGITNYTPNLSETALIGKQQVHMITIIQGP